jgi:N-acetylneuraminate lyase
MDRLHGIYPALLTPMHRSGSINFDELGRLVDWLLEQGVHGLYVGGTSGEGLLLEPREREEVVEHVIGQVRGRGKVMVHVGAIGTAEAVQLAQHAERHGADAIAAVPPFAFGRNLAGISAHYSAIAHSCELPLYLYNIPSLTAVHLRADDIARLAELPHVCGLKFSDYDLFEEFRIISLKSKLDLFHGCDETLLYSLMMGAVGGVGLLYNIMPRTVLAIYDSFVAGDWKKANDHQLQLAAFINEFLRLAEGNAVGLAKGVMSGLGFACGCARSPNPPVPTAAIEQAIELAKPFWKN